MPTPSPARLLGDVVRLNILVMPPSASTTADALMTTGAADPTSKPTAPIASPSRVTTSVRLTLLRRRISGLRLTLLRSAAQIAAPVLRKSTYTQRLRLCPGAFT